MDDPRFATPRDRRPAATAPPVVALLLLLALAPGARAQLTDLAADPLFDCVGSAGNACEAGDEFGAAVATGDLDGDGHADLVVGVPEEAVGAVAGAGALHIYYGYPGGLSLSNDEGLTLDSSGVPGAANTNDHFGFALATGDLDGDGIDDLAVSAPWYNANGIFNSGGVWIFWGSSAGISGSSVLFLDQRDLDIQFEDSEEDDHFGYALAISRRSGRDLLWIGVPHEDTSILGADQGCVDLVLIDADRTLGPVQQIDQDDEGFPSSSESGDEFGQSLAAGNFDGDAYEDIAIGAPREDVGDIVDAGNVFVMYGDASAIDESGVDSWNQDLDGVQGVAVAVDRFGADLAAGDFDDDGYDDLAIGIPGENVDGVDDAGGVQVLYGSSAGLTHRDQLLTQNESGVPGASEANDHMFTVAAGDFDGDGIDDLAVGIPDEDVATTANAGVVLVFSGVDGTGLATSGSVSFDQDSPSGMPDLAEANDFFGAALAAGDFDGNGTADLAIGVPGEDSGTGAVNVLYGKLSAIDAFAAIAFVSNNISVSESVGSVTLTVALTGSTPIFAAVDHAVVFDTATAGVDYTGGTGTLSWNQGQVGTRTFTLQILDDTGDEASEVISLRLENASAGAAIDGANDLVSVTILDDDPAGQIFADGFESANTTKWSARVP